MSRIIVKQLPKDVKESKLRELFSQRGGQITDLQLKHDREKGTFRGFAFIGFKTEDQAEDAINYFNNTYVDTNKIVVEKCADLKSRPEPMRKKLAKAFSKVLDRKKKARETEDNDENQQNGKRRKLDPFEELKDDPKFKEFLDVQRNTEKKTKKYIWQDDLLPEVESVTPSQSAHQKKAKAVDEEVSPQVTKDAFKDGAWSLLYGASSKVDATKKTADNQSEKNKKKKKKKSTTNNPPEDSNDKPSEKPQEPQETEATTPAKKKRKRRPKKKKNKLNDTAKPNPKDDSEQVSDDSEAEDENQKNKDETQENGDAEYKLPQKLYEFTLKIKGLPLRTKKSEIKKFFKPIKLISVRIARGAKSLAYISTSTYKEMKNAQLKDRSFFKGRQIEVTPVNMDKVKKELDAKLLVKRQKYKEEAQMIAAAEGEAETLAESGRIFVRNLSYTCTQEDLEKLFAQYGPLADVHLSIDSFSKQSKGFAFVTFVFPEHAIKAYTELDGTIFQGRLLHLIPAKPPVETQGPPPDEAQTGTSSYKKKKQEEQKKQAQSGHNWNALFLSSNAVADVIAKKFNIKKSELLADSSAKDSIATRMALAETQLVNETKQFLLDNGVDLDAFGNPAAPRSKTVILVKNLPDDTDSKELHEMFSKCGLVNRVVIPPSVRLTALVEMQEPTEAKSAFKKLAYKNFKHVPLYLEWAPVNVFKDKRPPATTDTEENSEEVSKESEETSTNEKDKLEKEDEQSAAPSQEAEEPEEDEELPEEGTVLFVKNLNFNTTEDKLKEHFSQCGRVYQVTIAKKMVKSKSGDKSNETVPLSLGFGFVQFYEQDCAMRALKELQHSTLDDHSIELKKSDKSLAAKPSGDQPKSKRKKGADVSANKQTGSKIVVRNVPFEATEREVRKLFQAFGEIKSVRLPKKLTGGHRGFAFVDFMSKKDAKNAFDALCQSTHLYGRRLVLEWAAPDPLGPRGDDDTRS